MFDFLLACLMVTLCVIPFRIWFKVRWHKIPTEQLVDMGCPRWLRRYSEWLKSRPVVSWGIVFPGANVLSVLLSGGLLWMVGLDIGVYIGILVFDCVSAHYLLSWKFRA